MKRALLLVILANLTIFGQWGASTIKLGYFNPSVTDGGFIIGYEGGRNVDEHLDVGWSIDWFHKTYTDQRLAQEFNEIYGLPDATLNELRAKTNLHSFPIMFTMSANWPVAPRLNAYITGGIGAELLLINYRSFTNPQNDEFRGAVDWSWRLGAGLLYPLGRRSEVMGELSYHSSEPSWEYEVNQNNAKRIFIRSYDMSGLMARIGVRYYY